MATPFLLPAIFISVSKTDQKSSIAGCFSAAKNFQVIGLRNVLARRCLAFHALHFLRAGHETTGDKNWHIEKKLRCWRHSGLSIEQRLQLNASQRLHNKQFGHYSIFCRWKRYCNRNFLISLSFRDTCHRQKESCDQPHPHSWFSKSFIALCNFYFVKIRLMLL